MSKLKGAANSMAQSFNSLMNFSTDYVMEIITEQMKKKRVKKVTIDILKGTIKPKTISREGIAGVIPLYEEMLDRQLKLSNRSIDDVKSSKFTITPVDKHREGWHTYAVECEIILNNGQKTIGRDEQGWLEKTPSTLMNVNDIQKMRTMEKKPSGILLIILFVVVLIIAIMSFYFGATV